MGHSHNIKRYKNILNHNLYGLKVHTSHYPCAFQSEIKKHDYNKASIIALDQVLQSVNQALDRYLNDPILYDLRETIISIRDSVEDLIERLRVIKEKQRYRYFSSIGYKGTKPWTELSSDTFYNLLCFHDGFRGLLQVLVFTLDDTFSLIKSSVTSRPSALSGLASLAGYPERLDNDKSKKMGINIRKLQSLAVLFKASLQKMQGEQFSGTTEKNTSRASELKEWSAMIKDGSLFPFFKETVEDVDRFSDIHIFDFLCDMGRHYVPKLQQVYGLLVQVTASCGVSHSTSFGSLYRHVVFGMANVYYSLTPSSAARKCIEIFENVNIDRGRAVWDLVDNGLLRHFSYLNFPSVPLSSTFRIPIISSSSSLSSLHDDKDAEDPFIDIDGQVSIEYFKKKYNYLLPEFSDDEYEETINNSKRLMLRIISGTPLKSLSIHNTSEDQHKSTDSDFPVLSYLKQFGSRLGSSTASQTCEEEYLEDISVQDETVSLLGSVASESPNNQTDNIEIEEINIQDEDLRRRSFRIGESTTLHFDNLPNVSKQDKFERNSTDSEQSTEKDKTNEGNIILHIHGGGFIAMSTFSHEGYLRHWARMLTAPIVSVEYHKAPEARFPIAVHECYAAYLWILENGHKIIGKPLNKIVIVGDSAGANMALAVCLRSICEKQTVPTALALAYPSTYLGAEVQGSPSRILGLIDPMVNYGFLKLCGECYIPTGMPEGYAHLNPFLSAATTPDSLLAQFPSVYICVGSLDPLFDDSMLLARRIAKNNGGRVGLEVWDGLGHGFLNLLDLVPEVVPAARSIARWIRNILNSDEP